MYELGGDWTLITGATTAKGIEMARSLAAKGENLVLVCTDEESLCKIARELNEISDIIIMQINLSKPEGYDLMIKECERLGLKITALFNFAR